MIDALSSCFGKSAFDTWKRANDRCKVFNKRRNEREPVQPYRCRTCGHFHIGRVDPFTRKRERMRKGEG